MTSKEEKYEEWRRYFFEVDKEMYEYFTQDLERLETLEKEKQELIECIKTMVFCGIADKYPLESGMLSNEEWKKMWDTYHKYREDEVLGNE